MVLRMYQSPVCHFFIYYIVFASLQVRVLTELVGKSFQSLFTLQISPVPQYPIYLLQSPPVGVDKIRTNNITLHHGNQS